MSAHNTPKKSEVRQALEGLSGYVSIGNSKDRIKVYVTARGCECEKKCPEEYKGKIDFEKSDQKKSVVPAHRDEIKNFQYQHRNMQYS